MKKYSILVAMKSAEFQFPNELRTHGPIFFLQRDNRISHLNASIRAQHKHESTMRAVRVTDQITEVKQLYMSPVNNWMGNHLGFIHFVFFQFGYDWQTF